MELDFKALAAGLLTAAVFAFAAHARDSRLSPDELSKPESCKATNSATDRPSPQGDEACSRPGGAPPSASGP